ncbi:MAG: serine protein kinase, partial [Planctomycetota bacterium]|nr:serine protein kinase [Planctomycetota bacterium]
MASKNSIWDIVARRVDPQHFRDEMWEGTFDDYLDIVTRNPRVARNAFQRIFDMILHFGTERYTKMREDMVRYKFFEDPINNGVDAIYGMERSLMQLVDFFKSAAQGYGTEHRILLLHGPVGSAKSTIARLLKKGIEYYSHLDEGALYSFAWRITDREGHEEWIDCPMHEEPLKLIPLSARDDVLASLNESLPPEQQIVVEGDLDPFCRKTCNDLLKQYDGNWRKVLGHIKVKRLILSE